MCSKLQFRFVCNGTTSNGDLHSAVTIIVLVLLVKTHSAQLHTSLEGYEPQVETRDQHLGLWSSVFTSLAGDASGSAGGAGVEAPPCGVYLHGGVGTGKTFMMDLFFQVNSFISAVNMVGVTIISEHAYQPFGRWLYVSLTVVDLHLSSTHGAGVFRSRPPNKQLATKYNGIIVRS